VTGIIQRNLPLLGANIHSYEHQIRSAFRRWDRVSLNHRTAAWLASYFDILFAVKRDHHRSLMPAQRLRTSIAPAEPYAHRVADSNRSSDDEPAAPVRVRARGPMCARVG
jgi:hypothetical protein